MFVTTFRNGSEQSYRYTRSVDGRETWTPRGGRDSYLQTERTMVSKFDGTCRTCGQRFPAGTEITWSKANGAKHVECPPVVVDTAADLEYVEQAAADALAVADAADALLVEYDEIDAADRLLDAYDAQVRARNLSSLKPGTYRVELSGRRDTDPVNLKITADKKVDGAFRFKQHESYESVGRVFTTGRVQIWDNVDQKDESVKRVRAALDILLGAERMGKYGEAYSTETSSCWRCGKMLKKEQSVERGMGKDCAAQVESAY